MHMDQSSSRSIVSCFLTICPADTANYPPNGVGPGRYLSYGEVGTGYLRRGAGFLSFGPGGAQADAREPHAHHLVGADPVVLVLPARGLDPDDRLVREDALDCA